MARRQPPRKVPQQGGPPLPSPDGSGGGRRVPWRLPLLAVLVAAVALVLASKSSHEAPAAGPAAVELATGHVPTSPPPTPVGIPRLVDLGADRCIPCKAMAPILHELRQEYAGVMQVDFIDVWKNPAAGDPYDIYSIPTQIFFDASGRELYRHQGFMSKTDILATWQRLGVTLTPTKRSSGV